MKIISIEKFEQLEKRVKALENTKKPVFNKPVLKQKNKKK